jgi:tripartite-type tricarboxylate transporter receptor subunit TctC
VPGPLRIVIGFSRGSASHDVAELIAPGLSSILNRPVELEFHPGESGAIAARLVAASAPDGNTLMMATLGTHALVPASRRDCGYHPLRDFMPLSLLLQAPLILVASRASGIKDIGELIGKALAAKEPLTYGSSAVGGAPHVAAALFARRAGIALKHVCYSDTRELYADLVSGAIDVSFNNLMSLLPLIRENKLVALGITSTAAHPALPDVTPIAEAGVRDYAFTNWVGIVGPAKLDSALAAAIAAALAGLRMSPMNKKDPEIEPSTAEAFRAHLHHEYQFWPSALRDLNLQA